MKEYGLFIGGEWIDPVHGGTFESRNPATGEILGTIAKGGEQDVHNAVLAAEKALSDWKRYPPPKRGEILLKAAGILREKKDELGELVTREMGKVIAEGRGEVQEAIDFFEYISGEGRRMLGETTTSELPQKFCMTIRQPVGVVGCITPWNFPMAVPSWKLGAALISGNTVLYKPATLTPLCGAAMMEVFEQAGLPAGVLNMVTGPADPVGKSIVESPKIGVISFTGGVTAGKDVYTRASGSLKRVGLELGGKNPQIIMHDADIDLAVQGVLFGAFGTAGQRCTATGRLIVHEKVYDQVIEKLISRAKALKIGNPVDPATDVGSLSHKEQEEKVLKYIEIGLKEGAKLLLGGSKLTGGQYDKGFFIEPTLFGAEHGMRITKEEIFGPVLPVIKAPDFKEAVRIANDVEYGLSTSIYTRDITMAHRAIDELESGITYINAPTIGAEVHLPFGGVKNTGIGTREAGTTAIEEFTEIKSVFIDYSGQLQKAQIDSTGKQ
jgi:aldehyde dehydrogenase (NAD+)